MEMNPEVKARWVAALRSGEYKQATGVLRRGGKSFCCLGVLCDLHSEFAGQWSDNNGYEYMGKVSVLPKPVMEYAHLPSAWGAFVSIDGRELALTEHNDLGRTFEEIAKAIEEQL